MKRYWVLAPIGILLLAACSSKPPFLDNGKSGQIQAMVFQDNNRNGTQDEGEAPYILRVGISQDISCPPSSEDKIQYLEPDSSGVVMFNNLKPGKYCVGAAGNLEATTKATVDVYVSSETISMVRFGVVAP